MDVMQNEAPMKNGADAGRRNDSCCESCSPTLTTCATHHFFHILLTNDVVLFVKKAT